MSPQTVAEQGCLVAARMGVLALGVWLQWELSNFELSPHEQRSCMLRTGSSLALALLLADMLNC